MHQDVSMGWILVLMVLIPALAFGGAAAYFVARSVRRNRLVSGNPEAAKLMARAQRALEGIEESSRLQRLPASSEVLEHARELTDRTLPELLERHGRLRSRVREPGAHAEPERRRAMDQLAQDLAETERTLESLVGDLETLDAQLASSGALGSDRALVRSKELVERLRLVEETCRQLEQEKTKWLEP